MKRFTGWEGKNTGEGLKRACGGSERLTRAFLGVWSLAHGHAHGSAWERVHGRTRGACALARVTHGGAYVRDVYARV